MGCLLGVLAMSCTSEDGPQQAGTGTISFNVATEASFSTKAVNESEYADVNRYTVEIWQGTDQISSWNYAELPESVEIAAGSYQVKAWYGEDKPASTTGMYVEGKADITVQAEQAEPQTVTVTCKPVCAKVAVDFSEEMDTYFSDYSVTFKTKALGAASYVWKKGDADPLYLKVEDSEAVSVTITAVKKSDGKQTDIPKTYTMSPQTGLTIHIAPVVNPSDDGSLGITIEIDTTTNDHEEDIEVPTEWI